MASDIPGTTVKEERVSVNIPLPPPVVDRPVAPARKGPTSYKNIEMERMIAALEPFLDRVDKIGYAAARNTRILRTETQEYLERREALIEQYGTAELDESGNPTGRTELRFDSPNFKSYEAEITEWAMIEHSPDIFKLKYSDALEKLTGREILSIDWMLED